MSPEAAPDVLWSVLIATQAHRLPKLHRLLDVLVPQADATGGEVEVVALYNNGEKTIHEYRQALLDDARGAYVSYADDDDLVAEDYVPAVLAAINSSPGVDFVAFRHAYYESGTFDRETLTGLNVGPARNERDVYVRPVTHINPIRTEVARQAGFMDGPKDEWEDRVYDGRVQELAKTEVIIDRVLYFYYHNWSDTILGGVRRMPSVPRRPQVTNPSFRWHPWSLQ